jgi:hypothetical protein
MAKTLVGVIPTSRCNDSRRVGPSEPELHNLLVLIGDLRCGIGRVPRQPNAFVRDPQPLKRTNFQKFNARTMLLYMRQCHLVADPEKSWHSCADTEPGGPIALCSKPFLFVMLLHHIPQATPQDLLKSHITGPLSSPFIMQRKMLHVHSRGHCVLYI